MAINLLEALQQVLLESYRGDQAKFAIENRRVVKLQYIDEINMPKKERKRVRKIKGHNHKGMRTVYPYAYGLSKARHPVLRAFQVNNNSRRGAPKWKFFRLDRITFWNVTKHTFDFEPKMFLEPNAPDFNSSGDESMSTVYAIAQLPNFASPLERERAKNANSNDMLKVGMTQNDSDPIIGIASAQHKRNVYTSQPNSKKYSAIAKNIDDTMNQPIDRWGNYDKAEAEVSQNAPITGGKVPTPKQNDSQPIPTTYSDEMDNEDWDEWLNTPHNND